MDIDRLHRFLDDPKAAADWLRSWGLFNVTRAHANLKELATRGVTLDLLAELCDQLADELPHLSDPDMGLNNLERFIASARNPLSNAALFQRDPEALSTLLQIFTSSQYLSDLLVADNEAYDLLRMTDGQPVARKDLIAELVKDVEARADERAVMSALRRFKRRETLRISYGDIVQAQSIDTVTRQISYLADAIVEAAVRFARRRLESERGVPRGVRGQAARFVVLALGKLGGEELNYSSDIDLIFLYDVDGQTEGGRPLSNLEFFQRLSQNLVRLLTEPTELGTTYRVDLRLRPEGSRGSAAWSLDSALHYYDVKGRTWERQAFVKARAIAGDIELGTEFLSQMEPWVYQRYLSLADITGIRSLKRRIENQTHRDGADHLNVKTGHGGIRDIEFVIQFLQLLNGGDLPQIRTGSTLDAIAQLEQCGCLTFQERSMLEENYRFLRKIEHRLQIMFDLQTHLLPQESEELRKVAIRMGFVGTPHVPALTAFKRVYKAKTELNRKILDHLLHDAFGEEAGTEPEVDLVNDPDPLPTQIEEVLGRYPFRNVPAAYDNLMALATEKIRFLSTRRSRHFLASIAPRLLRAIAETPDPDFTLVNLSQVSDSLGGKAALWELFSSNRPTLDLYVMLCAACPYLCGILTSNPGMIDELMDGLLLDRLPTLEMRQQVLAELCRGAEDTDRILHSFKDAQHLRVGVRDIVGKDDIQDNHAALSDIAEACLNQITATEHRKLIEKLGQPTVGDQDEEDGLCPGDLIAGQPSEFVILALGKLGGREPNYHSDLDVVFLYEADGPTVKRVRGQRKNTTTNQHFFSQLGQRIIKVVNQLGPYGRLYEVDVRLRPTGSSGTLALPIAEFRRYFAQGAGQLWERQALCKARVIYGAPATAQRTMDAVSEAAFGPGWKRENATEIRSMRGRLEETASKQNLKRGLGGTVDVEFIVQMLQLRHGKDDPSIRVPGTLDALKALHAAQWMRKDDFEYFSQSYRFQRSVEARIRLMNSAGRHELPADEMELRKLAYLLGESDASQLVHKAESIFRENRRRFEQIFDAVV